MAKILRRFWQIFSQTHPSVEKADMKKVVKSADAIFYVEKYEGSLFTSEIEMLDSMMGMIEGIVAEVPEKGITLEAGKGAPDPFLQALILLFDRWRDEAVSKLAELRTVHKDADFIIKMAQVCESYEEKLGSLWKGRATSKQLAQITAIRNQISKAIRAIEAKSEDIDNVIQGIGDRIERVLQALNGRLPEDDEFGLVTVVIEGTASVYTVPQFFHHFKSAFMQVDAAREMVSEINDAQIGYKAILVAQFNAVDNFKKAVEKIRSVDKKVSLVMVREKGAKTRMRRLTGRKIS